MPGFVPGGKFSAEAQQQLAQLLQRQQAAQSQQSMPSFPKQQQDFLNSLSAQQLQTLINQKSATEMQNRQTNQYTPNGMMQQPASMLPSLPSAANNTSALLADMANKAKAGMLAPNQLVQLRAIIEQQQSMQQAPQSTTQYANLLQAVQQPTRHPLDNALPPEQPMKEAPGVAQSVQFVRTIQQRVHEVEQKLATALPEAERQNLQRAHQELMRVQTALVQKLTQNAAQPASHARAAQDTSFGQANYATMPTAPPNTAPPLFPPSSAIPAPSSTSSAPLPNPKQFKRALADLMHRHGKAIHSNPMIDGHEIDLYHLFTVVQNVGGSKTAPRNGTWTSVVISLGLANAKSPQLQLIAQKVAQIYHSYLNLFEEVWNRAMLHQLSMLNGKRPPDTMIPMAQDPNLHAAPQTNPLLSQSLPTPPSPFPMMPAQTYGQPAASSTPRHDMPITPEQLSQLNLKPEYLAQLSQQRQNGGHAAMPPNGDTQARGPAYTAHWQGVAPVPSPAASGSNHSSPEKSQRKPVNVTAKMLEEAEVALKRVDASLATSRPKLPLITNISESERTQILQQITKLASLKATVVALLPAFLAMTGNIEPAKRVKIMIYMFDDQLALVPQRQCILRLSDLEKLKTQMTRCIGFVRVNDDKLAQQIVAKASQDMAKAQMAANAMQQGKRPKFTDTKESRESTPAGVVKTQTRSRSARTKRNLSPGTAGDDTNKKADTKPLEKDTTSNWVKQAQDELQLAQSELDALAQSAPLDFVKKTWNELLTMKYPTTPPPSSQTPRGDEGVLCDGDHVEAAVFALIDAPYEIAGNFQDVLGLGQSGFPSLPTTEMSTASDETPFLPFLDFASAQGSADSMLHTTP